jgi:hypothetical protein
MNTSTAGTFRLTILLFAALLGIQSIWLLCSEFLRTDIVRLPANIAAATAAARERDRATLAATIGAIRGDLWAQSAFTYADLLFGENKEGPDVLPQLTRVRASLERALRNSPTQSAAWLLRAGLGFRYSSLDFNAMEALKMSYYTGPSEEDLIPSRLRVAALSRAITDTDMRPFIRRDLRLLLARKRQAAIVDAYNAAPPASKRLIEQILADIDPSATQLLRTGAQKPSLPD